MLLFKTLLGHLPCMAVQVYIDFVLNMNIVYYIQEIFVVFKDLF